MSLSCMRGALAALFRACACPRRPQWPKGALICMHAWALCGPNSSTPRSKICSPCRSARSRRNGGHLLPFLELLQCLLLMPSMQHLLLPVLLFLLLLKLHSLLTMLLFPLLQCPLLGNSSRAILHSWCTRPPNLSKRPTGMMIASTARS